MAEIGFVRKSEFADKHLRCSRAWVTALDKQGRLVTDERGWVHVEQSLALIAESHGAPERATTVTRSYADERERGVALDNQKKEAELGILMGKLLPLEEVLARTTAICTVARSRLEPLPEQMAALLPEPHASTVRGRWHEEIEAVLGDLTRSVASMAARNESRQ